MNARQVAGLIRHIGRRGAFLLFLALLDAVIGYSLRAPLPYGLTTRQVYGTFVQIMPIGAWAEAWNTTGLVLLVAAFWRRLRPVAFALAAMLKTAWASVYLYGWVSGDPLMVRGYLQASIWLSFAVMILLVSGWRENAP